VKKHSGRVTRELRQQLESYIWNDQIQSVEDFEESNNIGINVIGLVCDVIIAFRKAGWKYEKIITLFHYDKRYHVVNNISRLCMDKPN
jgi:hypothetical protein